ncbi:hypothetical protein KBZ07_14010, partial [Cyanobium sp. BA20m-14]|nr:hypothetical protein [Cyanobium sp. BA20m-14]
MPQENAGPQQLLAEKLNLECCRLNFFIQIWQDPCRIQEILKARGRASNLSRTPKQEVENLVMATNLSDEFLASLLPEWYALLQGWAADGSLVAAAQEALLLNGTPEALEELTAQWAKDDFSALPPIVLLSSADISGALGAYAISTGTIYLNAVWLATASQDQVNAVLTEELGHHLDAQLNEADTRGDEGEHFSNILLDRPLSEVNLSGQYTLGDEIILLDPKSGYINAEAAVLPPKTLASEQFNSDPFAGQSWLYIANGSGIQIGREYSAGSWKKGEFGSRNFRTGTTSYNNGLRYWSDDGLGGDQDVRVVKGALQLKIGVLGSQGGINSSPRWLDLINPNTPGGSATLYVDLP